MMKSSVSSHRAFFMRFLLERSLRRVTFFLRRKKVTNFYRKATVGRVICAPPKRKNHALKILQDQRQRCRTADDSKFRLRPTAPSCRPERIPKPWVWHAFGYFSRTGKVPRRRQNTPFICLSAPKRRNSPITKTGRTRAVTLVRPVFKIKKHFSARRRPSSSARVRARGAPR